MIKAIIFDFDGVIHDTLNFHVNRIREFIKEDFNEDELKQMHEGNINLQKENPKVDSSKFDEYTDFVKEDFQKQRIMPEIKDGLIELSKYFSLYILSSGGENNIKNYLRNNNVPEIFKSIHGKETHDSKIHKFKMIIEESKLDKDDFIFITDTLGDILEANEIGIRTIAVTFGYHDESTLKRGNPYKIISDFSDIKKILFQINASINAL